MMAIRRPARHWHTPHLDQTMGTVEMQLRSWFAHHVPAALREGVPVRFLALVDAPAQGILKAARAEDVDLIVMAEPRHPWLAGLFHRSTAGTGARESVRPVLTVPTNGAVAA